MNKVRTQIWGREFELPVIIKQFKGKEITDTQKEAVERLEQNLDIFNLAKDEVEKYIIDSGLKEKGINEIDNIFKYVIPKSISVPKSKKRVLALVCNFKFDMEHGLSIIFENEKLKARIQSLECIAKLLEGSGLR